MGACIRIPGPPSQISITLPGGIKLQSQTGATQSIPNPLDPLMSLLSQAAPALGAIQPIFDIVGFAMAIVTFMVAILGVVAGVMLLLGNPFLAQFFPPPTIINTDDNVPIPGFAKGEDTHIPDLQKLLDVSLEVLCKAMKLVGLVPQLSMMVTVKDAMNAAMSIMSGVQAKINSLTDAMARIPGPTGDPLIDQELDCAREAVQDAIAHAAGPLSNLIPIMQSVSQLAAPINQGLPKPIADLIVLAVDLNLISFPSDTEKGAFMGVIASLQAGTLLDFPDLTNITDLPAAMDDLRSKLAPILGPLESVQALLVKLQNC